MIYATGIPLTYTAVASTQGQPSDTFTYAWAFDDNTVATGASYAKTWSATGYRNATVTATDQVTNGTATNTKLVTIGGNSSLSSTMSQKRAGHTQIILNNGNVLIVGGVSDESSYTLYPLASCEIYNTSTGTFSSTGSLNYARAGCTLNLLANGDVLCVGGSTGIGWNNSIYIGNTIPQCEVYSVASGTWTTVCSLQTGRQWHSTKQLPSGKFLTIGGVIQGNTVTNTTEIIDPSTWGVTYGVALPQISGVNWASSCSVETDANGRVIVIGGFGPGTEQMSSWAYTEGASSWTALAAFPAYPTGPGYFLYRSGHARFGDKILIVGGTKYGGSYGKALSYTVSTDSWSVAINSISLVTSSFGEFFTAFAASGSALFVSSGNSQKEAIYTVSAETLLPDTTGRLSDASSTYLGNGYVLTTGGRNVSNTGDTTNTAFLTFIGA